MELDATENRIFTQTGGCTETKRMIDGKTEESKGETERQTVRLR